jgi:energy-coupling factor transporter ATP-binding protein EcfA2
MPVGQLIGCRGCATPTRSARALALRLGLDVEKVRQQPFVKLSGGQKQKILIAIALGRDTRLLIMDEPAANLDPEARKIFFELLAERQHDTTMLISSHRLNEVASLVNRVVELDMARSCSTIASPTTSRSPACSTAASRCAAPSRLRRAVGTWNFRDAGEGLVWEGEVARPDRLRFLGMLSLRRRGQSRLPSEQNGRARNERHAAPVPRRIGFHPGPLSACGKKGNWPEGMAEISGTATPASAATWSFPIRASPPRCAAARRMSRSSSTTSAASSSGCATRPRNFPGWRRPARACGWPTRPT